MSSSPELVIAGTGRVSQALGRALREAGMPVAGVAGRSPERAEEAATFIGGGTLALSLSEAAQWAERLVIAVSDTAVESVAEGLAAEPGRIRVALHTCGNAGPERLDALAGKGVSRGSLHPLQTVQDGESGARALRGITWGISGEAEALEFAGEIVARLGGRVLRIAPGAHPSYHAAAVMASNYVAALLDAAMEAMSLAGIPAGEALPALAPLARTAVENAVRSGPMQALTGPIVRGDVSTVAAHIGALGGGSVTLPALYRGMGLRTLEMARRRGLEEAAESLKRLLEERG